MYIVPPRSSNNKEYTIYHYLIITQNTLLHFYPLHVKCVATSTLHYFYNKITCETNWNAFK